MLVKTIARIYLDTEINAESVYAEAAAQTKRILASVIEIDR